MTSFLSRLSDSSPEPELTSVIRNLRHVLNAYKGYGSVMHEFGLGDYDAHSAGDEMVTTLEREIQASIERHEHRVREPTVRYIGRDPKSWIRFRLAGHIAGNLRHFHLDMDTRYRNVVVSLAYSSDDGGSRPRRLVLPDAAEE